MRSRAAAVTVLFSLIVGTPALAQNPISIENARTDGVAPRAQWDFEPILEDPDIAGYAYPFSVNREGSELSRTVRLRIRTASQIQSLTVWRLGYYNGNGARKVSTLTYVPSNQPACSWSPDSSVDCGLWNEHIYVHDPSLPSGIYIARLVASGSGTGRWFPFVVRDDSRQSDMIFQTPDLTWQAYNLWTDSGARTNIPNVGGIADAPQALGIFYSPHAWGGNAIRASYRRPFNGSVLKKRVEGVVSTYDSNEGASTASRVKNENLFWEGFYTVVRWVERNGVNVSYTTGRDVAADYYRPNANSLLLPAQPGRPRLFVSAGHDEYWAQEQRDNLLRARDQGVHLAFLSGGTMFWRVTVEPPDKATLDQKGPILSRAEDGIVVIRKDTNRVPLPGAGMVTSGGATCTIALLVLDPLCFTGTWHDGRALGQVGRSLGPENSFLGLRMAGIGQEPRDEKNNLVQGHEGRGEILVSPQQGRLRFWRGTAFAPSGSLAQALDPVRTNAVGHEWDHDPPDHAGRPPGLIYLSSTPLTTQSVDGLGLGSGARFSEGALHSLVMFRDYDALNWPITFHAGSLGIGRMLDTFRANSSTLVVETARMQAFQRGMINLFADMGLPRPATLQDSNWWNPPIGSPATPSVTVDPVPFATMGWKLTLTGSASITGGDVVAAVEVQISGLPFIESKWLPAVGVGTSGQWAFVWVPPAPGVYTVRARAYSDRGFRGETPNVTELTVAPYTSWHTNDDVFPTMTTPGAPWVGTRFVSSVSGTVSHVRFYNPTPASDFPVALVDLVSGAVHSATGGGPSNWKVVTLAAPVQIVANRQYAVLYQTSEPKGFAYRPGEFGVPWTDGVLTADTGVYAYTASAPAPSQLTVSPTLYGVDVVFTPSGFWAQPGNYRHIWPNQLAGVQADAGLGEAEVGSRFKATTDGYVAGVRVVPPESGSPIYVSLWSRLDTGAEPLWTRLASKAVNSNYYGTSPPAIPVPVYFDAPVKTFADVEYVVSMHAATTRYVAAQNAPVPAEPFRYLGPVYERCPRVTPPPYAGFCKTAEANNPVWTLETGAGARHFPVDPVFLPTDSHPQSLWNPRGVMPMEMRSTNALVATRFVSKQAGVVAAVRYFNPSTSAVTVSLYDAETGAKLAERTAIPVVEPGSNWRTIRFERPVSVLGGRAYRVAYSTASTGNQFAYTSLAFVPNGSSMWNLPRAMWNSPREGVLGAFKSEYSTDGGLSWPSFEGGHGSYFVDVVFHTRR